jgi:hypothetical protein
LPLVGCDELPTPHGEREQLEMLGEGPQARLPTPHGERELGNGSSAVTLYSSSNPSWGTGTLPLLLILYK